MAKAYTRGQKLKNKKAKQALPGLAETPRREKDGRVKRSTNPEYERNAADKVLKARARHMGQPESAKGAMDNPALSEDAGKAIYSVHGGDTAKTLWDAYSGLTAAEAVYFKHYIGQRLHAKTAKVEYLIEVFEARPDDRPDTRDEDTKSRDASNNWARWRGYIMHLPSYQQQLIFDVAYGRTELMRQGSVTAHGKRFVQAVEALAEVLEKKRK